jgi:RNA recognition motif-containing protein
MAESQRWKATVYVGGLSPLATNRHVLDAFIPFGEIVEVQVPKNDKPNSTEPHKGFAYVEYEDTADAKEAIDNMDQAEFFGKVLKVSQAKAPKSADEGLGSKTAIWEQVSFIALIDIPIRSNKSIGGLARKTRC